MSSHHIWLRCSAPGCDVLGDIYTGNQDIDGFELAADYEQQTITARCDEHWTWTPGPDVAEASEEVDQCRFPDGCCSHDSTHNGLGLDRVGDCSDCMNTGHGHDPSQPCPPVAHWPFTPGQIVHDSGAGDDAAWLDAAPVGTVVRDRDGDPWTHTVMPGAHPAPTAWRSDSGALTLPAARLLDAFEPVTVESVPEAEETSDG